MKNQTHMPASGSRRNAHTPHEIRGNAAARLAVWCLNKNYRHE